jgi:uncharacterized membrane protein YkoI
MGAVTWVWTVLLAAALSLVLGGCALADGDDYGSERRHEGAELAIRGTETGEFVPLASIIVAVRKKYAGEIVETEFESSGPAPYYEFHLLADDGRVSEVRVDAKSGRILGKEADDD